MQAETESHARTLKEDGIVVIDDYLDGSTCDELYERISTEIEHDEYDVVDDPDHGYSYSDFVNWGGPVVNKRTGSHDEGMLDIFNVDEVVPDVASFKSDEMIQRIVNGAAPEPYSPDNVNVYWNRSVTNTRNFHADTYGGKFKSFLYLTDVPDRTYGPFGYVKGSHRASNLKIKISKLINEKIKDKPSTDAVFYDEDDVIYCTAPKGTLIISNQGGYHRGHPQEEGKERMLLTTSYTPTD